MLSRIVCNSSLGPSSLAQLACSSLHLLRHVQRQLSTASTASAAAAAAPAESTSQDAADTLEFPGGRVPFTHNMEFLGGPLTPSSPRIPCYRTLDGTGKHIPDAVVPHDLQQQDAVALYTAMAKLQVMDTICYDAQRQGRFSFFMTCAGEEATVVGSAAGLDPRDMVFSQYREHGVLLWRGFSFDDFANQLYGNSLEPGQGRQMPIHYGSKELNYQTVSSPLATQLPHAAGAAYAMKLDGADTVAAAYFGEGASSEGDFHAALNFAATLGAPCLFICRNNGYAISTPANEQYAGDGIACRGTAYGMPAIRVDGGDARAVYCATRAAREIALRDGCPVLIEAMSYRSGHHSTSDDSSRYRTREEMVAWRARDPVVRFRHWLVANAWWDEEREKQLRHATRQQVIEALEKASKVAKPPVSALFSDVYADMPWHLQEQLQETLQVARRHPHLCPPDMPVQ
uniref:3-methyl-2-oxobutanoate dehydrogenase (2-methylpropanoyl-transferring) n=2 Tax=Tetradesmus obliquus TaxID=3088 RepID=A0A383WPL1_TETOB|eukprot:jgi/Sobl393_1/8951/SZX79361.1